MLETDNADRLKSECLSQSKSESAYQDWLKDNIKYIVELDFWPWLERCFADAYKQGWQDND